MHSARSATAKTFICLFAFSCGLIPVTAFGTVRMRVADETFLADGINPTSGTVDVFVEFVEPLGTPPNPFPFADPGDPTLSWDIQTLSITNFTGSISSVTPTFGAGNLLDVPGVTSNLFVGGTGPFFLQGIANGTPSPTLDAGDTFVQIDFEIPAGETGTFDVLFNGVSQFGIFDDQSPFNQPYTNVGVLGGTITIAVPEPSAFLFLALCGIAAWGYRYGIARLLNCFRPA